MEPKKFEPLFKLDKLITEKSYKEKRPQRSIKKDLCDLLDITAIHLARIRRAQVGDSGYLSTGDLIKVADYFGVTLNDLLNKDLPLTSTSGPGSNVSSEEPGLSTIHQA